MRLEKETRILKVISKKLLIEFIRNDEKLTDGKLRLLEVNNQKKPNIN
jgi:hypothetical protein